MTQSEYTLTVAGRTAVRNLWGWSVVWRDRTGRLCQRTHSTVYMATEHLRALPAVAA